ncbi:MAG: DegT/DnrJ/EryC1/StrS family aminotransferase [Phycisphaerales bacterium]|jgi:dTDP-4-amino-4,6-dideoxygalactose transaminase
MNVPFFRVDCSGRELHYLQQVLESGWLTTSRFAAQLEQRFAETLGVPHAIAVNSCTAALHLAVEALGVGPGTPVLVPTLTFTATAEVVRYLGGQIVLCDVDPRSGLLTPEILAAALDRHPEVRVVMPVHFGGLACDLEALRAIAEPRGVAIVEDAAHAFPTRYPTQDGSAGAYVGAGRSAACCFSFYANKTMTTGEGGLLVTRDDAIAERVRRMRLHGIDRDVWKRFTSTNAGWQYDVVAAGYKYNMPDLNAAVGLAQFERAFEFHESRVRLVERYFEELSGIDGIELPVSSPDPRHHAWHLFPIVLSPGSGFDRDAIIERLAAEGVGTSVHYRPLHRMTYWQQETGATPEAFPGAEHRWQGTFSLPLYPSMREDEQRHVVASLRRILNAPPIVEIPGPATIAAR